MAGVGRTGTLMAIINSIITLREQRRLENPELSIFSIVRRLREQRFQMCETKAQYEFIYKMVRQFYGREKKRDEAYGEWKSQLVGLFNLPDHVQRVEDLFSKMTDPTAMKFFVEASDKIISTEIGSYDMIIGVGPGGFLVGPMIAQKHGVPYMPVNSAIGLGTFDDDLTGRKVLLVDSNLNFSNRELHADVITSIKKRGGYLSGLFVPTI